MRTSPDEAPGSSGRVIITRGILSAGCCAWTGPLNVRSKEHSVNPVSFPFMFSSCNITRRFSTRPFSLNNLVRSCQHVGRYCEIDLFGCLQIDDELEFRRLLNGEVGGLGAFQNLVDVDRSTLPQR